MTPQRFILGYFVVQSGHPSDLRDSTVDHLDGRRVREHLHGVVEQLRVVAKRRGFRDGSIRGVTVYYRQKASSSKERRQRRRRREKKRSATRIKRHLTGGKSFVENHTLRRPHWTTSSDVTGKSNWINADVICPKKSREEEGEKKAPLTSRLLLFVAPRTARRRPPSSRHPFRTLFPPPRRRRRRLARRHHPSTHFLSARRP